MFFSSGEMSLRSQAMCRALVQSVVTLQRANVPAGSQGRRPSNADQAQNTEGKRGLPFGQAPGTQHSQQAYQILHLWLKSYFQTPPASKATTPHILPAWVQEVGGVFCRYKGTAKKGEGKWLWRAQTASLLWYWFEVLFYKIHLQAVAWPEIKVKWNDVFFSLDNSIGFPETCKITSWGFMSMCSPPPLNNKEKK